MTFEELSVWDWIAMHCHKNEWHSAANVAEFLSGVEKKLWGNPQRQAWEFKHLFYDNYVDNTDYPANFLVAVARNRDIKWGCFVSGYDCDDCSIAKKQGKCNQRGSISHFWQYVLLQDSGESIDEELQKDMKESLVRIWMK
jgi:hypothetical protein